MTKFFISVLFVAAISCPCFTQSIPQVKIGDQTWMSTNLDTDKFSNGDPIPEAKTEEAWEKAGKERKPSWCYYDNDPANGVKYGKLYNWFSVSDPRNICPAGWHVPGDTEWTQLVVHLGGEEIAGTKMKKNSGWAENGNGINSSGFAGLPGGWRNVDLNMLSNLDIGSFDFIGLRGYWWSSTGEWDLISSNRAGACSLNYYYGSISRGNENKANGFSVRCVRD